MFHSKMKRRETGTEHIGHCCWERVKGLYKPRMCWVFITATCVRRYQQVDLWCTDTDTLIPIPILVFIPILIKVSGFIKNIHSIQPQFHNIGWGCLLVDGNRRMVDTHLISGTQGVTMDTQRLTLIYVGMGGGISYTNFTAKLLW